MKKILIYLFIAAPLFAMDFPPASLQAMWESEIKNSGRIDDKNLLEGKHVIFFSGLMNEFADLCGLYFTDNIEAVRHELGGSASYFGPSSELSIPDNVEIIHHHILATAEQQRKPLILVGHSKAGPELLQTILRYPELILQGVVFQVLLIQPALHGSPLADYTPGFLFSLVKVIMTPNLATLNTLTANEDLDAAFVSYQKALLNNIAIFHGDQKTMEKQISSRIFFVKSQIEQSEVSFGVSLVLTVIQNDLSSYNGSHDGLLPLSSQEDDRIGIDLGVVHSDHIGLTISTISNVCKDDRKAFTRVVFRVLAEAARGY